MITQTGHQEAGQAERKGGFRSCSVWWYTPVTPATGEAETEELLEHRSSVPAWVTQRTLLKKTNRQDQFPRANLRAKPPGPRSQFYQ
jgi:hypothetical protein